MATGSKQQYAPLFSQLEYQHSAAFEPQVALLHIYKRQLPTFCSLFCTWEFRNCYSFQHQLIVLLQFSSFAPLLRYNKHKHCGATKRNFLNDQFKEYQLYKNFNILKKIECNTFYLKNYVLYEAKFTLLSFSQSLSQNIRRLL